MRYFTKRANMSQINRALQYIEQNEEARWVKAAGATKVTSKPKHCEMERRAAEGQQKDSICGLLQVIHCYPDADQIPTNLEECCS